MAITASSPKGSRGRGRPREFDVDDALDKAARVFREKGYHATSIADLTEAMELASGSVYKAFKDKQAVFLATFEREGMKRGEALRRVVSAAKSGRDGIRGALTFYAECSYGSEGKRGCLVVGGATELSILDPEVVQQVTASLHKVEALLVKLIRQGQADGSIRAAIDCEATARLMLCVLQGMRVVGKTGRTRAQMSAVADTAMKLLD
jgi:TetR/AcrR family transcriptional regulator, transcriptional repressor for nem operon